VTFADHFSTVAARYATYRPHYPAALVEMLAERSPQGTAWDIGCGTGHLSVALGERFGRVIATDPAQALLDQAPPHPRVEYRCASAEISGLPDASVELAVAAQAAHWFDWPRFVAEVERVARPGALLALVSYGILVVDGDPGGELMRFYRDVVAPYWPKGREHVENGYRNLAWPWPPVEAPAVEMTATWARDELLGYVQTWSATVKLIEREGPAPVVELHDRLARCWPDGERRSIRWPLAIRLARR
jgi:ubiquinone/menaquinone biosynthesis C-methylase UbiE